MNYKRNEELNNPNFNPEDYAPVEETVPFVRKSKPNFSLYVILSVVLVLVLALFSIIFASKVTEDNRPNVVKSYFADATSCEYYKTVDDCDIYLAYYKDYIIGYGVFAKENGFGDKVTVLVCLTGDSNVSDVVIIDENEGSGFGYKISSADYLKQFKGLNITDEVKDGLISGATASSGAVVNAIKRVLSLPVNLSSIEKETGKEVVTPEKLKEIKTGDTTKADVETTQSEDEDTHYYFSPDTGIFNHGHVTGYDNADNNNQGGGNMSVDGSDVTTVYDTLTDETTAVETTAVQTTAAPVTNAPTPVTTAKPVTAAPVETTAPAPETTGAVETTGATDTTGEVTP